MQLKRQAFLCVRRGPRAVCLERIEGYAVQSLAMLLGGSLPLYAGAAPRALLAFLPVAEQSAILKDTSQQLRDDPPRPDDKDIIADIARIRSVGYSVSDGDVTPGIASLGAPVFNHRGEVQGALSLSGLRGQVLNPAERGGHHRAPSPCSRQGERCAGLGGVLMASEGRAMGILQRSSSLIQLLAERGPLSTRRGR